MVDRLGEAKLEDLSLQSAFQEILNLQRKHIIQTHPRLIEHTNPYKTANQGVTLEQTLRVLRIELEELTSGTTDL